MFYDPWLNCYWVLGNLVVLQATIFLKYIYSRDTRIQYILLVLDTKSGLGVGHDVLIHIR